MRVLCKGLVLFMPMVELVLQEHMEVLRMELVVVELEEVFS